MKLVQMKGIKCVGASPQEAKKIPEKSGSGNNATQDFSQPNHVAIILPSLYFAQLF